MGRWIWPTYVISLNDKCNNKTHYSAQSIYANFNKKRWNVYFWVDVDNYRLRDYHLQ